MIDSDFNVSMLQDVIGIGGKQLYRKTKTITGRTPVEYIREMRMSRAAELLSQGKFSVSEVMYTVGFSNSSYFSKCFAKGADVSWLTEMEKDGVKFYNQNGKATECMKLLREEGTNSIRLRVWVNPEGGWCGKDDVIAKAWRAQQLGFRLMIDFHYSDTWADPGNQKVPAAWQGYTAEQMKQAVADHTKDVLTALKDRGVTNVEWVQVGNETRDGMLFNSDEAVTGQVSKNAANFAAYVNAGYDAVKAVYPQAKVIVHVDEGNNLGRYTWLFGELKKKSGKWDVIGMSLYPEDNNWQDLTTNCLNNIKTLSEQYNCHVIFLTPRSHIYRQTEAHHLFTSSPSYIP
jgi:arabinogalactan endo-1,4-beta-galactosidase